MDASRPPQRLRVLIVEDSEDDALLLLAALRHRGYDVTWRRVETGTALEGQLTDHTWDLVISDDNLPQFNAREALGIVRERAGDLPFIIVSGDVGAPQAEAATHAGANDCLLKGEWARIASAVERALSRR